MNGVLKETCDVSSPRSHDEPGVATAVEAVRWSTTVQKRAGGDSRLYRHALWKIAAAVAEVNPALVLTATIAGAVYRYSLLWCVLLAVPIMLSVISVCRRITSETKLGLVEVLRRDHGSAVAIGCAGIVLAVNLALVVADLMAVTESFSIILQLPRMFFVAAAAFVVWYVLIFRNYQRITRLVAVLALPLLIYLASMLLAHANWPGVVYHSLVPDIPFSSGYPTVFIAILGSLLMPHALEWQNRARHAGPSSDIGKSQWRSGPFLTVGLCYAIMVSAAALLHVADPDSLTTRMASQALAPAVGPGLATVLFALAMIGAGMAALPALISAMSHSASQALGWRSGLHETPWEAKRFYVLISSTIFVAGSASFARINPVSVLYWSQIFAGILMLPVLGLILLVSNDRRSMRTANSWWQNFWIGAGGGSILCAALLALWWRFLR